MKNSKKNDEYLELIEEGLKTAIRPKTPYGKDLSAAMEYSLFTGGKRLRPLMTIRAYEMYDEYIHKALPFALAIEMIHTYSLIHDDLPSMDNDDYRRGKLTTHKVYGEGMAILTGDALLNLAFETMIKAAKKDYNINSINAMYEVGKASGHSGMIGGQVLDIKHEKSKFNTDDLIQMYKGKTAALIQASILSGAISAGAADSDIKALREFGYNLGLAYQIKDDLLDNKQDNLVEKCTYLSYFTNQEAALKVKELSDMAVEILEGLDHLDTAFFKELTLQLVEREI